jgi:hypothetical protein
MHRSLQLPLSLMQKLFKIKSGSEVLRKVETQHELKTVFATIYTGTGKELNDQLMIFLF